MRRRGTPNDRSHRRATGLMIVVIALLIIVGMASSLFRLAVLHHGQSRRFEMQAQADWLAREGARRAAARLADDRDFPGDTWRVTLDTLGPIQVVTQVTTPTSRESTRGISSPRPPRATATERRREERSGRTRATATSPPTRTRGTK